MGAAGWFRDGTLHNFNRFWGDFGTCVYQLFDFKKLKFCFFCSGLFPIPLLSISASKFRRLELLNRGFRMAGLAKTTFQGSRFKTTPGSIFVVFWRPWGPFF